MSRVFWVWNPKTTPDQSFPNRKGRLTKALKLIVLQYSFMDANVWLHAQWHFCRLLRVRVITNIRQSFSFFTLFLLENREECGHDDIYCRNCLQNWPNCSLHLSRSTDAHPSSKLESSVLSYSTLLQDADYITPWREWAVSLWHYWVNVQILGLRC